MKKLYTLTALFLAVCLLASCSPVKNVRTTYGEMNFPGLEWMMTPEEVFRAIGKNESDFQKGENGALGDIWYEVYYTADGLLFGKLAKVQFVFCPSADRKELRLWAASVTMQEASEDAFRYVCGELDNEWKRQGVTATTESGLKRILSTGSGSETFEDIRPDADPYESADAVGFEESYSSVSTVETTDLPEELLEKYRAGAESFYREHETETKIQDVPAAQLSTVRAVYTERKNSGESTLNIYFSGNGLCNILTYAE